jgi:hypothetical protein
MPLTSAIRGIHENNQFYLKRFCFFRVKGTLLTFVALFNIAGADSSSSAGIFIKPG